jgi:hypothetical protein
VECPPPERAWLKLPHLAADRNTRAFLVAESQRKPSFQHYPKFDREVEIGETELKSENHPERDWTQDRVDPRRKPRFKIGADIVIHSRTCGELQGQVVDLSESGISALLKIEVPLGEVVDLEFTLPFGAVTIQAKVRQRTAFRYGFQFAESDAANDAIRRTCRSLAIEEALRQSASAG